MASKAAEEKKGVVIGLVIFVLLTIILGVVAYQGYAGQAALLDDKKKAEADRDTERKKYSWAQFKALLFKAYAGHATGKTDLEDLAQMRSQYDGGSLGQGETDRTEVDAIIKKLDDVKVLGWDAGQRKPVTTYAEKVAALTNELTKAYQERDKMQAAYKGTKEEFDGLMAAKDEQVKKLQDSLAAAQKTLVEEKQNKSKEYLEALATMEKQALDIENFQKEVFQMKDEAEKRTKKFESNLLDYDIKYQKLQKDLPAKNLLEHDTPKGRIVSLGRDGVTAYINLGSDDNVKPQLTFSIVGVEVGGQAKREPKGTLEVANVVGPKLSLARITQTFDPRRNPIVTNDLLFNPAWSPTMRDHIAIAGLIDITGDGRDDLAEFMRSLEQRYGIIVDSYLDLKDYTVKGKGMSFKTTYLVLGDIPKFSVDQQILTQEGGAADKRLERQSDIHAKVIDMQKEATRYGTTPISLRKFLTLIGYKVPRGAAGGEPADFNLYRNAPPEPKSETPTPTEETPKER